MPQDTADLVIVGAGTIGVGPRCSPPSSAPERVVVLDAGHRRRRRELARRGIVRTQGGTATAVDLARWTVGLLQRRSQARYGIDSGFRTLGYLILAFERGRRAGGARALVEQQRAAGWTRAGSDAAEAGELLPLLDAARITRRDVLRRGRRDRRRRATWRRRRRAEGSGRGPARAHAAYAACRIEGGRVSGVVTARGVVEAERVILAGGVGQRALTALAGGARCPGRRGAPSDRGDEPAPRARVRPAADGLRPRARAVLPPGRGGLLFGMSNPDEQPGEAHAIDWDEADSTMRARLAELDPADRASSSCDASGRRRSTTRRTTCRSSGRCSTPRARPLQAATIASAGGHGMMWGPAVARMRGGPRAERRDDRHRRVVPRRGPLRRARRAAAGDRPDRAAVPGDGRELSAGPTTGGGARRAPRGEAQQRAAQRVGRATDEAEDRERGHQRWRLGSRTRARA